MVNFLYNLFVFPAMTFLLKVSFFVVNNIMPKMLLKKLVHYNNQFLRKYSLFVCMKQLSISQKPPPYQ